MLPPVGGVKALWRPENSEKFETNTGGTIAIWN
jgi:hypothetical protein